MHLSTKNIHGRGENLSFKGQREAAKLSVIQAADRIGVKRATIYAWENGSAFPRKEQLGTMLTVYGCDISELLSGELEEGD